MKRLISSILLLAMLISLFAGCGGNAAPETTGAPTTATTQAAADGNLADAVAYVRNIYKEVTEITAADYERIGVVPMGTTQYEIEWSVDVTEDLVKIVKNENGMVTIDVNEDSDKEVPYVLTATLTDGTNTESLSWNHILPKAVGDDMSAIVDMAYALEDGQALSFEATLTGTISTINTAWSDDYQNITVTMLVEGLNDKPIMCYRLTGEGAKDLAIGDLITVTGTLKNYKGTIEFDAGCVLDAVQKGAGTVAAAPTDPAEILEAAYGLGEGQSLPYNATLTGKIIRVDTKWSSQYKNITVTIAVEGHEDKPIMCYRLKGDGAEDLCIEDTITVSGVLKNYYGTIEFDAGCTLVDVVPGPRTPITFAEQPSDILKIMQDAYKLTHGHYLPYNLYATGVVTEVNTPWSDKYGNITVTIEFPGAPGYPLVCYRMVGEQYGADTIEVGDTITIHGSVTNYKGTIELDAGCWCYKVVKGEGNNNGNNDSQFAKDLEEAAKLGEDEILDRESTITGTITSNPYESSRNPGTYSFWVKDADGNSVQCYYVPVTGGVPAKGDTVTVTGHLSAYDGKGQFYEDNATATLVGKTETDEEEETNNDPAADSTLTIAEAVALGESKDHNSYTEGKYYVTGVITEVYNTTYGNMYIKDASGNILTIFGSYSEDGETRYDKLADKPVAGDTITVYGIIGQYNGTAQMKNGWIKGAKAAEDTETEPEETEPTPAPASEALAALLASSLSIQIPGETTLPATFKYENSDYTVSWAIKSATTGAATLTGTTLKLTALDDAAEVVLTATVTLGDDTASGDLTKISIAGTAAPYATMTEMEAALAALYDAGQNGTSAALPSTVTVADRRGTATVTWKISPDTVTNVTLANGIITETKLLEAVNYNLVGTITYNGATKEWTKARTVAAKTFAEQMDEAVALGAGKYNSYASTFTGTVSDVARQSDFQGKRSYSFTLSDGTDSVYCYKINVEATKYIADGDTVTITAKLTSYNSKAQFAYTPDSITITHPAGSTDPDAGFVKPTTEKEIVEAAFALASGETLAEGPYTLTLTVTKVEGWYSNTNTIKNVYGTTSAESGSKEMLCYKLKAEAANAVHVGDVIKVAGTIKNYKGTVEFDQNCTYTLVTCGH